MIGRAFVNLRDRWLFNRVRRSGGDGEQVEKRHSSRMPEFTDPINQVHLWLLKLVITTFLFLLRLLAPAIYWQHYTGHMIAFFLVWSKLRIDALSICMLLVHVLVDTCMSAGHPACDVRQ